MADFDTESSDWDEEGDAWDAEADNWLYGDSNEPGTNWGHTQGADEEQNVEADLGHAATAVPNYDSALPSVVHAAMDSNVEMRDDGAWNPETEQRGSAAQQQDVLAQEHGSRISVESCEISSSALMALSEQRCIEKLPVGPDTCQTVTHTGGPSNDQRPSVSLRGGGGSYDASPRSVTALIRIRELHGDVTSVKSVTEGRWSSLHPEDGAVREQVADEQVEEEQGPVTKEVGVQMYPPLTASFVLPNCGRPMTPGEMLVGYKRGSRISDTSVPPLRFSELQKHSPGESEWSDARSGTKRAQHRKPPRAPDTDDEEEEVEELEDDGDAQSTSGEWTSNSGVTSSGSDCSCARRGFQRSRIARHRPPTLGRFKVPAYAVQAYSQLAGARRDIEQFLADHTRTKLYASRVHQCVQAGRSYTHVASRDESATMGTRTKRIVSSPHAFVNNNRGFSNSPKVVHRESVVSSYATVTTSTPKNKYVFVKPDTWCDTRVRQAGPIKVEHIVGTPVHDHDERNLSSQSLRAQRHTHGTGAPKIACQCATDAAEDDSLCSGRPKYVHWTDMSLVIPHKRTYTTVPTKNKSMATCELCEEEEWINARTSAWRSEQFVDSYGYERQALRRKVFHAAEAAQRREMADEEERRGRRSTFVRDAELRPREENNQEDVNEINGEAVSKIVTEAGCDINTEKSSDVHTEDHKDQNADAENSD